MCSICDLDIAFAIDHPMTLSVAVATRAAIEEGRVDPAPADPPGALGALRARTRAIEALRAVQDRLERALAPDRLAALPDFFVLMIEMGTWGFFRATASGFDPNCRPEAPRLVGGERDSVIVMSEAAARALAAGRLPFERAVADGLVAVDAEGPRHETIVAAFHAAWPEYGFSRYVCA